MCVHSLNPLSSRFPPPKSNAQPQALLLAVPRLPVTLALQQPSSSIHSRRRKAEPCAGRRGGGRRRRKEEDDGCLKAPNLSGRVFDLSSFKRHLHSHCRSLLSLLSVSEGVAGIGGCSVNGGEHRGAGWPRCHLAGGSGDTTEQDVTTAAPWLGWVTEGGGEEKGLYLITQASEGTRALFPFGHNCYSMWIFFLDFHYLLTFLKAPQKSFLARV